MKRTTLAIPVLFGLGLLLPARAGASVDTGRTVKTFKLYPTGINRVTFESDAPIENIVGLTTAVSGEVNVSLTNPRLKPAARISVDLDKVRTGIEKRDEHMRSSEFLNTAEYPTAVFALERVAIEGSLEGRRGVKATIYGKFSLHGVTRNISLNVKLGHRKATADMAKFGIKGDVLRIKGSFYIKMSDYGIKVPSKLGAKVANTVKISLALTGYTG